mgnify:CR=1 FL=1
MSVNSTGSGCLHGVGLWFRAFVTGWGCAVLGFALSSFYHTWLFPYVVIVVFGMWLGFSTRLYVWFSRECMRAHGSNTS